jgi:hypothetical protein
MNTKIKSRIKKYFQVFNRVGTSYEGFKKNFPALYGARRFITVFKRSLHWYLFWARSIKSIPSHPIPLRSILILFTNSRLGLPSGSFLLDFPPISYMHFSSSHSCYMPCPSHPPCFDHFNYTSRRVQVMKLLMLWRINKVYTRRSIC